MDIAAIRKRNLAYVVSALKRRGATTRTAQGARLGGLAPSYLSQLLGGKFMGEEVAKKISIALGHDGGWMDRPQWEDASSDMTVVTSDETPPGYVRFQLLDGAAGMGDGVENEDYPEVIREVDIAGWEVRRKLGSIPRSGRIKLLTGRGPSMRPMIDNGDVVMVDTEVNGFDGDAVYVINIGGETLIKMLQMRGDGLYVVSANPDYPAYRIEREGIVVGGKVVSVLGIKSV
ncbi:S24 family peptidase [Lysobacter antibioticus]|uniref:S24 family peptidase n=1 Tax=Lysobacter antibioticus TaxID=84531 RepID=UPI0007E8DBD9|nr:S24 family peptidase [Lysobacter antibioticus]